jgi:hypothetical protein
MDANDEIASERIMKLLKANGYLISKNDVIWILDRMTEEIDNKVTEASNLERKIFFEVITTSQEIRGNNGTTRCYRGRYQYSHF